MSLLSLTEYVEIMNELLCQCEMIEVRVFVAPRPFPVAVKHCGWHTGMTVPLRPPNGSDLAEKVGDAFRKVMAQTGDR